MNILVLNCGSSSVKFQLIATTPDAPPSSGSRRLAKGLIERIGGQAIVNLQTGSGASEKNTAPLRDHTAAVDFITRWVCSRESGIEGMQSVADIHAIGHRVVHGGESFKQSVLIDESVLKAIEACIDLAPLHNPANLKGIKAAIAAFGPGLPQIAVFDTSFHQTLPEHAFLYAVPYQFYRRYRIRRYGFHGTSHRFIGNRYRQITGKSPEDTRIISLHLGNGCSAAAISHGKSVDTSMGLTPLEGLVMGTRSGDIDPAIIDFIVSKEGMSPHAVEGMLNTQSGLLGISGLTNDMRDLLDESDENNDRRAVLSVEMFAYRARKYIGAYLAAMNGADAIVFTGGIGENSPRIRDRICAGLNYLGIELDGKQNDQTSGGKEGLISTNASRVELYVIPTDEELMIALDTAEIVKSGG
jgi:acetate kinase